MTEYVYEMSDYHDPIREQIVRCRDCKFCMAYMAGTYCDYMAHSVEHDGFCAWGLRRNDTENGMEVQ